MKGGDGGRGGGGRLRRLNAYTQKVRVLKTSTDLVKMIGLILDE